MKLEDIVGDVRHLMALAGRSCTDAEIIVALQEFIEVPDVRQTTDYSCGAASLVAVCRHFSVEPDTESEAIQDLGTSPSDGTSAEALTAVAQANGLECQAVEGMTLTDLAEATAAGRLVLCCIQAWDDEEDLTDNDSGHWVVVFACDDGRVQYHDPVAGPSELPQAKWLERWHDKDVDGKELNRFGIVMWKGEASAA